MCRWAQKLEKYISQMQKFKDLSRMSRLWVCRTFHSMLWLTSWALSTLDLTRFKLSASHAMTLKITKINKQKKRKENLSRQTLHVSNVVLFLSLMCGLYTLCRVALHLLLIFASNLQSCAHITCCRPRKECVISLRKPKCQSGLSTENRSHRAHNLCVHPTHAHATTTTTTKIVQSQSKAIHRHRHGRFGVYSGIRYRNRHKKTSKPVKMHDEQLCKLCSQFIEIWVNKHFQ